MFVGRTAELAALAEELATASSGVPRVVLVTGPPGSGKSSLLRRFVEVAAGASAVPAAGEEAESLLPLGLLDQLSRRLGGPGCAVGADPLAVGAELLALLDAARPATAGPLLVTVDDLHWADTPSLQAITFAARRLFADPVLLVLAGRDDDDPRTAGLQRLAVERGRHLVLGGLAADEIVALGRAETGRAMPRPVADRVRRHTDGLPLAVTALVRELGEALLGDPEDPLPAPKSYAILVLGRLSACADEARRLVIAAAVLGLRCELPVAAALADLDDPLPALGEASAAGLLDLTPGGRQLAFAHPLVRAAVYHDLPPDRRCGLHARAAALTTGTVALEHRAAAVAGTDAAVADALVDQAQTDRATGAVAAGGARLLQAARLHPDPDTARRLLLDGVADLLVAGEVGRAAAWAPAVADLPAGPRQRLLLGRLAMLGGRQEEAARLLADAVACAEAGGDRATAATAALTLGQLRMLQARADEAAAAAGRALALGADAALTDEAEALQVLALGASGRAEEGLSRLHGLVGGADREELNRLLARGIVRLWSDDLSGASGDLAAIADGSQPVHLRLTALGCLAKAEYRRGAWDDSLGHGVLAVTLAEDADHAWHVAFLHAVAGLVPACRGDDGTAAVHARRSREAAELLGAETDRAYAAWAGAHLAWTRGDPDGVLAAIVPVRGGRGGYAEPAVTPWRELHAAALVALGRFDEAAREVDALEELARARGRRSTLAAALTVRGRMASSQGQDVAAVDAFEEAIGLLDAVGMPFARALAAAAYGAHLRRRGRRRDALDQLTAARACFDRLGAVPFVHRVEREVVACGGARSTTARRPTTLTPQETAVTRLVADGLTNRQIAAELVVSVKTVEYHLGHVYAKLGVQSRAQLAARVARAGG